MMLMPTWIVHYRRRRPSLTRPLTRADYLSVEVGAIDRDGAARAFNQRYSGEIVSISMGSATGFA